MFELPLLKQFLLILTREPRLKPIQLRPRRLCEKMVISKDGPLPDKSLAKFILLNDLDIDIMRSQSFIDYVNAVAEYGSNYRLPCYPDLKKEIGEHVANVKKSWDRTGCTLISAISCDKDRCFIYFFAYSVEGMVLLRMLEILKTELTGTLMSNSGEVNTLRSDYEEMRGIVQYITNCAQKEINEHILISNCSNLYQTNCVAYEIYVLFEDIYHNIKWIRKVFDQARAVVANVCRHNDILLSMKQFPNNWELKQSSTTKFYSNYSMLQSIMGQQKELQSLVSSPEWLSLGFEKDESRVELGELISSSEFWSEGKEVLHALEPIFRVLCLVYGYGATSGFLYAAVEIADESIRKLYETNVHKYQMLWAFFKLRKRNIIHPIHAGAAFLNPAYFRSEKFKENNAMELGINFILEKLVRCEEKAIVEKEMWRYRSKEPDIFNCTAMTMLRTFHPCDWWDYCGDDVPVLKKYAIQILSQPCSTSFCRQTLSALETAQTKKWKPLMPAMMEDYLYVRTNALLMENFNTMKEKSKKPLDLEKLGELPDCTEFINENFTHDLVNENEVPLSDGKLHCWLGVRIDDLRLHFMTELPSSLVEGNEVKGERGAPIHVVMVDSRTGSVVQSGCPSELELTVTVVGGDFDEEAGENWTREFFESHENKIMRRKGKMPLLNGNLSVLLDEGRGTLGAIAFNYVSSWRRSGEFRLAVKTKEGYCEGIRVYEGISNAFALAEERVDVSTDLALYEDLWKIRKKLTGSDLSPLSRLLLPGGCLQTHVLPQMDEKMLRQVKSSEGMQVVGMDVDTGCKHWFVLHYWLSSGSYMLNGGWTKVVKKKRLKVGDQIGMVWFMSSRMFNFKVFTGSISCCPLRNSPELEHEFRFFIRESSWFDEREESLFPSSPPSAWPQLQSELLASLPG